MSQAAGFPPQGFTRAPMGNPRWMTPLIFGGTNQNGTIDRVHLNWLWIPRLLTVDEMSTYIGTLSAGNSFRLGIYQDNGGTPADGALLWDSGDFMPGVTGAYEIAVTPNVQIERGWAWLAIATEDAVMAFFRGSGVNHWSATATDPMVNSCRFQLGSWGALTDPCPAVTRSNVRPNLHIHVVSIDE